MGDEQDSWLQVLGVHFDPPDPDAVVSGLKEAAKSELNAVQDLRDAKTNLIDAARTEVVAKTQYVEAGVLDGVGAHETAQNLRNRAGANESDASDHLHDGLNDLSKAGDDLLADDDAIPREAAEPKSEYSRKVKPLNQRKVPMGVIPMLPDCKIVRGKVPGPANHVLCCTHHHIVDLTTKTIIALNLEDYQKRYGTGGGGA